MDIEIQQQKNLVRWSWEYLVREQISLYVFGTCKYTYLVIFLIIVNLISHLLISSNSCIIWQCYKYECWTQFLGGRWIKIWNSYHHVAMACCGRSCCSWSCCSCCRLIPKLSDHSYVVIVSRPFNARTKNEFLKQRQVTLLKRIIRVFTNYTRRVIFCSIVHITWKRDH